MKNEPVLTAATVSSAIIAVLALFHVGVNVGTVQAIVAVVLPLIAALIARSKVSPV